MTMTNAGTLARTATAEIVSAYVANNSVQSSELPRLIETVYASVTTLDAVRGSAAKPVEPPVSAKKSITPDFLISLEDGQPYKSLKRHLARHGLTPQQYRRKWGLPYDYPMVAPNYAKRRSELARQIGLGSQARRDLAAQAGQPRETARRGLPR